MADTLPPDLRTAAQAAHIALTCISTHPTLDMSDYLRGRVDAAAAGLEAALAAVPARTLTDDQIDAVTVAQWGAQIGAMLQAHRAYARAVLAAAPQAVPVPAVPVASVTECEACFTPDACRLRGKCDHYAAEQLRVAKRPDPLVQWGDWTLVPLNATEPMQKAMQVAVLLRKSMNDVWRAALAELPEPAADTGAELERLRQALRDIADPIAAWQRDLQPGYTLDGGMCVHMANDPETYKRMAREALRA